MDREIRQAEKDGDYQRLYALLKRVNRHDEANSLFLDHPIQVDCVLQYQYKIFWRDPEDGGYYFDRQTLRGYRLDQLINEFIELKVGAAQISHIEREPICTILGEERRILGMKAPLRAIALSEEEIQKIKEKIKSHPHYMQGATTEQLDAATRADGQDAEKARRKILVERRQKEAEERKQAIQDKFESDSRVHRQEIWDIWIEHCDLPRPRFACAIQKNSFGLEFILFKLKDVWDIWTEHRDLSHDQFAGVIQHHKQQFLIYKLKDGTGTGDSPEMQRIFATLWNDNRNKRLGIWKRSNSSLFELG